MTWTTALLNTSSPSRYWLRSFFLSLCLLTLVGCGSEDDDSSSSFHGGDDASNQHAPAPPPKFGDNEILFKSADNVISGATITMEGDTPFITHRQIYAHPTEIYSFVMEISRHGIVFTADRPGDHFTHASYYIDANGDNLTTLTNPIESNSATATLQVLSTAEYQNTWVVSR